jgi:hypothetical protein
MPPQTFTEQVNILRLRGIETDGPERAKTLFFYQCIQGLVGETDFADIVECLIRPGEKE